MHRALTVIGNPPKFKTLWRKGQPIYYDKLMLGCAKKNLEESYLLATNISFLTRQTYVYVAVS